MANIINIEFTPCPDAMKATYKVRYRRNTSEGYATYPTVFTASPILISVEGDPSTQQYEGFLDTYCNGVLGPQVPFSTGPFTRPPTPTNMAVTITLDGLPLDAGNSLNVLFLTGGTATVTSFIVPVGNPGDVIVFSVDLLKTGGATAWDDYDVSTPSFMMGTFVSIGSKWRANIRKPVVAGVVACAIVSKN